jgi:Asp-tRNA(Asn)/Glu-tRNA(Gln) amidotransferase A subunit family amidase
MSAMTAAAGAGGLGSLASPLALDAATIGMHEAGAGRAGSVGSASAGPPAFSTSSGHAHATPSSRGPVSARRPRRTKPSARPQETDPAGLTVAEASALIRRAELSPVELVEACLARIEALDPVLMAFNTVVAEAARDHARAITDVAGAGALFGVPVALKDNYYTAGIRTTANSHIFADFVPDFDAEAWRRLRAQGAILLGKTQMGPLATSRATTPDGDNTTLSAWAPDDPSVSPGGSSSGSATAVAARMAPAATGTQTGGSITNPAQEQGLTGLKPTMGRISLRGIIPLTYTRDHPGPLARDAMDAAILLQAMAGPDPADPRTLGLPPVADYVVAATPVEAAGRPGLRWRTRIGVIPGYLDASPAGPEPTDAPRSRERTEAARLRQEADAGARRRMLSTFEELGAESIELRLPRDWETLTSWDFNNVRLPERAEPFLEHLRRDVRLFGVSLSPWINGLLLPGTEYLRGQRAKLLLLRRVLDDLFAQCDVVVQTSPIPFDMIGLPLVAFPIGVHDDGARRLPQGALLGGHPYAEDRLLSLVAGYQAVTQWHRERPSDPPVAGGGRAGAMPRSVGPRGRTDVWDIMAGGE